MMHYEQPSEQLVSEHLTRLGITSEGLRRDAAALRDWLRKQPHLPDEEVDDVTLQKFLIHSKNRMEVAKEKLEAYYSARVTMKDTLSDRDPLSPAIAASAKVAMFCPCPRPTPAGERVTIVKVFRPEVSLFDIMLVMKTGAMLMDAHMDGEECTQHITLFDFDGTSAAHAATFTLPVLKRAISVFLGVMPQRFAGFHLVNAPAYFEAIITLCKSLMSTKLAQRVHVHGKNLNALYEYIPKEVLPAEYGGTYPKSLEEIREMAYNSLVERRDWFLRQDKIASDESRRTTYKEHNPLDGSFRKITID